MIGRRTLPWWLAAAGLLLATARAAAAAPAAETQPRNVVLVIADGFGFPAWSLAHAAGRAEPDRAPAVLDRMMDEGRMAVLVPSPSGDDLVIDSASAATTYSTGVKVGNDRIGMGDDGRDLTHLATEARARGKAVGLVTNTSIVHATPAGFFGHVSGREQYDLLATQLVASPIELFLGGGLRYFIPAGRKVGEAARVSEMAGASKTSKRRDDLDLLAQARDAGFRVVTDAPSLAKVASEGGKTVPRTLGLFAASHIPYAIDRIDDAGGVPALPDLARAALELLSRDPDGFFLMIEAGEIDLAAHANDAATLLEEVRELDRTLGVILEQARRDGRTLVVLTADHDTAAPGFSYRLVPKEGTTSAFAPTVDSGSYKKRFANAGDLATLKRQRGSFDAIVEQMGDAPTVAKVREVVEASTGVRLSDEEAALVAANRPWSPFFSATADDGEQRQVLLGLVLSDEHGITFASHTHTSTAVPVICMGPGADACRGVMDQPDVHRLVRERLIGP